MMYRLFIIDVGNNILGHLCGCDANHVPRSMVAGFGVLIVLPVFTIGLQLGYVHIMDQLGIILEASKTHMLALGLLISFLVFILQRQNLVSRVLGNDTSRCSNSIHTQKLSEHCDFLEDCTKMQTIFPPPPTPQKVQSDNIYFHHFCVIVGVTIHSGPVSFLCYQSYR